MALKILCRVKKLTTHQGRDKKGVDCQCYHLSLKRSTNRNWFWKIERPGCRREVLKSSHSREGLHIRIWTCWSRWWWSGKQTGRWSDLPSLLGSPLLPPTQGTSSTLGAKEDTFRWVKKRSWDSNSPECTFHRGPLWSSSRSRWWYPLPPCGQVWGISSSPSMRRLL